MLEADPNYPADARGESRPSDQDVQSVYDALHRLAGRYLGKERIGHTLQPTALVHEAFVKLAGRGDAGDWNSRTHFQAVASSAMRQILVDYARARGTQKRGGDRVRVTLTPEVAMQQGPDVDLIALDEALRELAAMDERKSRVVELRFFGGLTCEEAARSLGISPKTAEADWYMARAWLHKKLAEAD